MKSVLNTIGKPEISRLALGLEQAAKQHDLSFMKEKTEEFINALKSLIEEMS
jgi:hypothetical protein